MWHRHLWLCSDDHNRDSTKIDDGPTQRPPQLRFNLPAPILEWSLEGSVHWTCLQQSGPRHFRSVSSVANLFLAFSLPRTAKSVCATKSILERDVFVGDFGAGAASGWFVVAASRVEVVAAAWGASAHCACSGTGCGAVGASA